MNFLNIPDIAKKLENFDGARWITNQDYYLIHI